MKVELRDPNKIMKLSRLGSFHQSKLSFLRSFLNEFKEWEYKKDLFNLDARGFKNLEKGLKKIGFNEDETNGILGNNWYNFYKGIK